MLSRSVVGVRGGVLKGLPLISATLALGGAKSVPLNTAAVWGLMVFGANVFWLLNASASACSTVQTGAKARSPAGMASKRLT